MDHCGNLLFHLFFSLFQRNPSNLTQEISPSRRKMARVCGSLITSSEKTYSWPSGALMTFIFIYFQCLKLKSVIADKISLLRRGPEGVGRGRGYGFFPKTYPHLIAFFWKTLGIHVVVFFAYVWYSIECIWLEDHTVLRCQYFSKRLVKSLSVKRVGNVVEVSFRGSSFAMFILF